MDRTLSASTIFLSLIGVGFLMPSVRQELVEYYTRTAEEIEKDLK